jgi:HAD superfamily hydrolase (TIGR01549 family)
MKKIKAVILDCDGVILNSNGAFLRLYEIVCKNHGIRAKPHDIYKYFGENPKKILKTLFKKNNVNDIYDEYTGYMRKNGFLKKLLPYKGVSKAISEMSRSYKIAVASGGVRHRVLISLKNAMLMKYFDVVMTGDDVKRGKPNPEMLHRCMKKMNVSNKQVVYVGDAPSDIIAAKRAKVLSIAVLTGVLDRKTAKKMKADYIVSDLTKVPELLKKLDQGNTFKH